MTMYKKNKQTQHNKP